MNRISAIEALELLKEGNARFASAQMERSGQICCNRRKALATGQSPFAIILGCSDSRVPAEIIFDQGLGDLFVIRIAGNVVFPSQIGSIEFAAEAFGTQLIVVLGHSCCGAVQSALQDLKKPNLDLSPNLRSILDAMKPGLSPLTLRPSHSFTEAELLDAAIEANVHASVAKLKRGSERIREGLEDHTLLIVGATYCLETGKVHFLEESAASAAGNMGTANAA
jgi:carbonic anhydrase